MCLFSEAGVLNLPPQWGQVSEFVFGAGGASLLCLLAAGGRGAGDNES